ncbi:unnamed protein product, partial [Symbiodinium sp. KB8]
MPIWLLYTSGVVATAANSVLHYGYEPVSAAPMHQGYFSREAVVEGQSSRNRRELNVGSFLAAEVWRLGRNVTALELGCGNGQLSYSLNTIPGIRCIGLDGYKAIRNLGSNYRQWDLQTFFPMEEVDFTLSFEIGEHIAPEAEESFLGTLRQAREGIVLAWATPGQAGHGHVNGRWQRYLPSSLLLMSDQGLSEAIDNLAVNSTVHARSKGLITVSAPAAKRLALAVVSLEAARFGSITDNLLLWLVGSWTSGALFRSPLMSIFSSVFIVAASKAVIASRPVLYALPRSAAQEPVLLSVLLRWRRLTWLLLLGLSCMLLMKRATAGFAGRGRLSELDLPTESRSTCGCVMFRSFRRPLAYFLNFIAVGCPMGQVLPLAAEFGRTVGPAFALANGRAYGLADLGSFEWLLHLLRQRKLRSVLLRPPTSTLLGSAWPAWRSYDFLKGRLTRCSRTFFRAAMMNGVICVLMHPASSFLPLWPEWRPLAVIFSAIPPASCKLLFSLLDGFNAVLHVAGQMDVAVQWDFADDGAKDKIRELEKGHTRYCLALSHQLAQGMSAGFHALWEYRNLMVFVAKDSPHVCDLPTRDLAATLIAFLAAVGAAATAAIALQSPGALSADPRALNAASASGLRASCGR